MLAIDAMRLLKKHKITHLVIVDKNNKLIGVVIFMIYFNGIVRSFNIKKLKKIKLVGFDVDSVFTDGRFMSMKMRGKAFPLQDGQGIRNLIEIGIKVLVISGRKSKATEKG